MTTTRGAGSAALRACRGTLSGLLRQYFPKGIDFDTVTDQELRAAADEINDRLSETGHLPGSCDVVEVRRDLTLCEPAGR